MFNHCKVTLVAMTISLVGSILLTLVTVGGLLQPTVLRVLCFLTGSGKAWAGLAGLRQRAGSARGSTYCNRSKLDQLQHRAQLRSGSAG
jgi:hypothetical protein